MKSIIEREATFENNSDMEVKETQKQLSRAFVEETQWSETCSTVKSTWQAKHRGWASHRSKFVCLLGLYRISGVPDYPAIFEISGNIRYPESGTLLSGKNNM